MRAVCLVLSLFILFTERDLVLKKLPKEFVDESTIPKGACEFVKKQNLQGKMFNTMGFGGYIDWSLGPQRKVFMDGRYLFLPMISEYEGLKSGEKIKLGKTSWSNYFKKYDIDYALTKYEPLRLGKPSPGPFQHESVMNLIYPKEGWALVFWDDNSLVFLKREPQNDLLVQSLEFQYLRPYDIFSMANDLALGALNPQKVLAELKNHYEQFGYTDKGRKIYQLLIKERT